MSETNPQATLRPGLARGHLHRGCGGACIGVAGRPPCLPLPDLRQPRAGQELAVLADLPDGAFELPLVLVDQPPPLLLLLGAALLPAELQAEGAEPDAGGRPGSGPGPPSPPASPGWGAGPSGLTL